MNEPRLVYSRRDEATKWAEADDRELLAALAANNELALDEIVRRKTASLISVVQRIVFDPEEARDIVQVAFLRIWEHRDRYDGRWAPNTWIYRIATNLAIDHLRSRKSRDRQREPYRAHLRQVTGGLDDGAGRSVRDREISEIFETLAAELTEKQRAAFVLREMEGLSTAESAAVMDCRESTVRNHLFNARKALQTLVRERYPEYAAMASRSRT